ncbi:unnamed protein product, partial [marine sediment metagenome]
MNTLANALAIFSPYIAGIILELYDIDLGMRLLYSLYAVSHAINATLVLKYLRETSAIEKTDVKRNILAILKETYAGIPELIINLPR